MVKALFFDLTNTLQEFNWNKQWSILRKVIAEETGYKIETDTLKKYYQQTYEIYRLGVIRSDNTFLDLLFRQLGLNITKKQLRQLEKRHMNIRKNYTWLPEKYKETMEELNKHFKLVVVSSGVMPWAYYDFESFFNFQFENHFDLIVDSYSTGYLKNSGKLFDIAFKKTKLKPEEVAFVGDDYKKDILLAKKHGMKTIFLNKKREEKKGNITIKKLSDLANLIEDIKAL